MGKISQSYLKELAEKKKYKSGGFSTQDKQFSVKKSTIPGANKGLFSKTPIKQGKLIGLAHENNQPVGTLGNMHNHSETPNMQSVKVGNQRYVYATRDIQPGEELTTNYRLQPELEQPEDFMGAKRFGQVGFQDGGEISTEKSPIEMPYVEIRAKRNPLTRVKPYKWDPNARSPLAKNTQPQDQLRTQYYKKPEEQMAGISETKKEDLRRKISGVLRETTQADKDWAAEQANRKALTFSGATDGSVLGGMLDFVNPFSYYYAGKDAVRGAGETAQAIYEGNPDAVAAGLFKTGLNAAAFLPATQVGKFANAIGTEARLINRLKPLSVQRNLGDISKEAYKSLGRKVYQEAARNPFNVSEYLTTQTPLKSVYNVPLFKVGRDLAAIEKEGKALGLSDFEIARRQMEQVGITSNQRKAYIPGVSDFLEKYVVPYGYSGPTKLTGQESKITQTLKNVLGLDKNAKYSAKGVLSADRTPAREDAWSLYLGKPQQYGTFRMAETAPVSHPSYPPGSLKGMDIYSLNAEEGLLYYDMLLMNTPPSMLRNNPVQINRTTLDRLIRPLEREITIDTDLSPGVMGGYNKRLSSSGLQYNDIWDLNPSIVFADYADKYLPKSIKDSKFLEKLLYKTSEPDFTGRTVLTPKSINIPIDKFIGKPFMSHGNLPYTWAEHQQNMLHTLNPIIENKEFVSPKYLELYNRVKNAKPIQKNGGVIPKGTYQMGGTMGIPGVNGQVVSSGPQPLTSVKKTRGPITKTKAGVKTMSNKQVKKILKNIK